jgi:hypothetical protein
MAVAPLEANDLQKLTCQLWYKEYFRLPYNNLFRRRHHNELFL